MSSFALRMMLQNGSANVGPSHVPPVENASAGAQEPPAPVSRPVSRGFVFETPVSHQAPRPLAKALPPGPAADFWDLTGAVLNETLYVENSVAYLQARAETAKRWKKQVYEATGVDLPDPFGAPTDPNLYALYDPRLSGLRTQNREDNIAAFEAAIEEARLKHPDKAAALPSGSLAEGTLAYQREIYGAAQSARERFEGPVNPLVAELLGGLGGSFGDPLQVATLPVGLGARTIVGAAMKEAAVNMGITGGLEVIRDKAAWGDVTGREYTAEDMFSRVATAGAFGGLLGAGGKTLQQGGGRLFFDRSSFEVFRTKYDALPADHPFRRDETLQRAIDVLNRTFREEAERPAGVNAAADAANRTDAAAAAAGEDAPRAPDPVRDELLALLDRNASAEEIWQSQAARDAETGGANQGATLQPGEAIPDGRVYRLPDAEGVPREGDAESAIDWLIDRAAEAAGPSGVAREKRALFVIGYPGAGKSTFVSKFARRMRGAFVDADLAKTIIPEYEGGAGSQRVHNESAALRLQAMMALAARGDNIVFETVGNSAEGVLANVNRLKAAGYAVELAHVRVDPDEAVRRSWRRWMATGRSIQPQYARNVYGKIEPSFDALVESGAFSGYIDIDYSGARQDVQTRRPANRSEDDGSGMAGQQGGGGLAVEPGGRLLGEAEGPRGIPDLEDEIVSIREAARLAAAGRGASPPPTSPAAVFDSTVDPAIARAAEDPTPENLEAASEVLERELAAITGEGVDDAGQAVAFSFGVRAFHGSPHKFDRFEWGLDRAGTGEGSQAFGWGLYFAQDKRVSLRYQPSGEPVRWDGKKLDLLNPSDVAGKFLHRANGKVADAIKDLEWWASNGTGKRRKFYKSALDALKMGRATPARHGEHGALYEVELRVDDETQMLDLDARMSDQSPEVQAAVQAAWAAHAEISGSRQTLQTYFRGRDVMGFMGNDARTSELLAAQGLKGLRFYDGFSRAAQQGSRNFVVFNPDDVAIYTRNGEEVVRTAGEANIAYSHGGRALGFEPIATSAADDLAGVDPSRFAAVIKDTGYAAYRLPAGTEEAKLPKGYAVVWHSSGAYAMSERHMAARRQAGQASFARVAYSDGGLPPATDAPPARPASVDEIQMAALSLGRGAWAADKIFTTMKPPKWAPLEAKAMTNKQTGEVTIFEGRVTADEVPGLLLHEIGAHAGIEQMIGVDAWDKLLSTVMARAKKGEGAWAGILDAIPDDTPVNLRAEEALGYFLERNADMAAEPWWKKLMAAVRAWAARMLPWLDTEASDAAIVDLARAAVSRRLENYSRAAELPLSADQRVYGPGAPDDLGFITSAERAIAQPPARFRDAKKLSPAQWRKLFREAGATSEAFTYQIEPALKTLGAGDITREQMTEALARNRVAMGMAGASARSGPTARERELAEEIQMQRMLGKEPSKKLLDEFNRLRAKRARDGGVAEGGVLEQDFADYIAPGPAGNYKQEVVVMAGLDYKSHNWNSPGALGHIRTTRRNLDGGGSTLHVEELQSDLHQEGAKQGYRGTADSALDRARAAKADYDDKLTAFKAYLATLPEDQQGRVAISTNVRYVEDAQLAELLREAQAAKRRLQQLAGTSGDLNDNRPPRAPMENWEEPFVRHALQSAAKGGYDVVTFPTHATLHPALQNEGTAKFYDKRLPNTIARVAKSLGLKVETADVPIAMADAGKFQPKRLGNSYSVLNSRTGEYESDFLATWDQAVAEADRFNKKTQTVSAIRLTDEAKTELLQGVVAYSQGSPTGKAQPAPAGSAAANPKQPQPGQSQAPAGPPSPALARQRHLERKAKIARANLKPQMLAFRNGAGELDIGEFLLAILDYHGQGSGLVKSVDGHRKGIVGETLSEMEAALDHFQAGIGGRRVNRADLDNFVKEMFGEDTKDPAAKALAQVVAPALEKLRQRFNKAGGQIGRLDRWGLPQAHDALAMRNWIHANGGKVAGRAALKKRLYDSLDITRMRDVNTGRPMSAAQVWNALDSVIEDILTDGAATRTPSSTPATSGMLANQRAEHRFLIFRDAETWLGWQREFGQGDPVVAVLAHVERMAKDIAAMEILGPNPDATIQWIQQSAQNAGGAADVGRAAPLPKHILRMKQPSAYITRKVDRMNEMWANYTGAVNAPVDEQLARRMAMLRNLLTSSSLGSAILSALPTDPVFGAMARWFAGTTEGAAIKALIENTKNPRHAAQMSLILDHSLATFGDDAKHARELAAGNWSNVLASQVIAVQGLSVFTRKRREQFQMGFLADLGNLSGDRWDQLPPAFQRTFIRYGFAATEWDKLRGSPLDPNGFMRPENIRAHAGRDIADRVRHMLMQEVEYAVPSGSLRSRSLMRGRDQAGTFMGELRQSGKMFMSFSATLPMTHGYRVWHQLTGGRPAAGALYAGALLMPLMLGGAVALQMKNVRDGKDLQDMRSQDFWKAAFLQGGGLGIYGDFLFSNLNRMDRSMGETLAGPAVGFLSDVQEATLGEIQKEDPNLAASVGRLMLENVPGSSLWYLKGAYDRWIEDGFAHLVNPKADENIRRRAQDLQRSTGQGYFWERGTAAPQRGPEVAEPPPPQ